MVEQRKAMGGGVQSLFNNTRHIEGSERDKDRVIGMQMIPLSRIVPNATQPRTIFDTEAISELASSIERYGVLQPIVVKPHNSRSGVYEIIAGERRFRACKEAGVESIPAVIQTLPTKEAFVVALIENIQREPLNPMEEANALCVLKEEFGYTQEELARQVGKSRSVIANSLRLINLSPRGKQALELKEISSGHARLLLVIEDVIEQEAFVEKIVKEGLSVRATELLLEQWKTASEENTEKYSANKTSKMRSRILQEIQQGLSDRLALKVRVKGTEEKGSILLPFSSKEELDRMVQLLERTVE